MNILCKCPQIYENYCSLVTKELRKTILLLWEGGKSVISPESLFTVIWKVSFFFIGKLNTIQFVLFFFGNSRLFHDFVAINRKMLMNFYAICSIVYTQNCPVSIIISINNSIKSIPLIIIQAF